MVDEIYFKSFKHFLALHNDKCVMRWQAHCLGIYHVECIVIMWTSRPSSARVGRKVNGKMMSHRVKIKDADWVILIWLECNFCIYRCNARTCLVVIDKFYTSMQWWSKTTSRFGSFLCLIYVNIVLEICSRGNNKLIIIIFPCSW